MKKKSGGLLKRTRGITQKLFTPRSLKPQSTRKIIRRFHVLLKHKGAILKHLRWDNDNYQTENLSPQLQKLYNQGLNEKGFLEPLKLDGLAKLDVIKILGQIDGEIDQNGGLQVYQIASTQGQSTTRGSDSSKKLVEWLNKGYELNHPEYDLSALEIGCLSPNNFISTCKIFKIITRIDLNSQHHLIQQQNFMLRPLPKSEDEKFNLISCSLVLNFVTTPEERGEMLKRITKFLKPNKVAGGPQLSSLFLVLPLPCISNSRYLNHEKLLQIMRCLGFSQKFYHESNKLAYWLFDWNSHQMKVKPFNKIELCKGGKKNNFAIVIKP